VRIERGARDYLDAAQQGSKLPLSSFRFAPWFAARRFFVLCGNAMLRNPLVQIASAITNDLAGKFDVGEPTGEPPHAKSARLDPEE
jgi:hypothetical protein